MYCTTATGCQSNCSYQIYHNIHASVHSSTQSITHSFINLFFHSTHPRINYCAMDSSSPKVSPHVAVASILFCHSTFRNSPSFNNQTPGKCPEDNLSIFHLIPQIRPSLALPFLRVRSGSHSTIFCDNLFPITLFTCPYSSNRFPSVASNIFFHTSTVSASTRHSH
jgi:hypothetical protein